jgi:hypothetical protein
VLQETGHCAEREGKGKKNDDLGTKTVLGKYSKYPVNNEAMVQPQLTLVSK